ncbi:beta-L-arabinofuranosidase domain-containing protein [Halalkalibacter sp. AB-rgal2]|uniref:beta-L-arabinofuranosidase domain-containing protein n=1 Tax=Halalkalibacter sp. AB-rgal2 TaxID=3242695 RepID=UPI00359EF714
MDQVYLLEGLFKQSETIGKEYLLYLDIDRLLAPCYEAVSKQPRKPRYGGWESTGISGHSVGHWLSAMGQMYEATKDESLKDKVMYTIDELALIQSYDTDGYVGGFPRKCFDLTFSGDFEVENFSLAGQWVPWYSLHKLFAGCIDVYRLMGLNKALEVVVTLANWAKKGTDLLTDEQFQRMLICEHGGMNEAMADLYDITGNKDFLELAIRFCHEEVLEPLAQRIDQLEGKHANTQIPKVIGAAKLYNLTGEKKYKDMAIFFWNEVTTHRSYVIGGNSINEHFGPLNSEKLGVQSAETCNTYNMLKLTELLFGWDQKSEYFDFYEKALYNHILASQDPDSGMKTYFVSTQPGHFKVYCSAENSFWCCTGTGMENPARYSRGIYYSDQNNLFVNLFISSRFKSESNSISIKQETEFPLSDRANLFIEHTPVDEWNLHIRVPYWVNGQVIVDVNGQKEDVAILDSGYICIRRKWKQGDKVTVQLPMNLHMYVAKDDQNKIGFMYGPIVLAGALGKEQFPKTDILENHLSLNNHPLIDVPTLVTERDQILDQIYLIDEKSLTFETEEIGQPGQKKLKLIPFYQLHHQRYTLYWHVMNEASYNHFIDDEKETLKKLRERTIDEVQPHEQQPEVEHQLKKHNSRSGYFNVMQKGWRDCYAGGYFSYELKVSPNEKMALQVMYVNNESRIHIDGGWYKRQFTIEIDGTTLSEIKINNSENDEKLFVEECLIPFELTKGKETIEVKFTTDETEATGRIYEVRTVRS